MAAKTHKVVRGDNLSTIAKKYGTTVDYLVYWNKGTYPSLASNRNLINVGWTLKVSNEDGGSGSLATTKHDHTNFSKPYTGTTIVAASYQDGCPGNNKGTIPKNTKVKITAKCVAHDKYQIQGYGWVSRSTIQLDPTKMSAKEASATSSNKSSSNSTNNNAKGTVNPVNSVAYDITTLLVTEANAVHGIPYQFMDDVDARLDDKVAFGNVYIDRFIAKAPILLMSPGLPNFLPSYTQAERQNMVTALVASAGGNSSIADNIQQLIEPQNGRYYTFEFKYDDYFFNVNKLCRYGAVALGIQDVVHSCNGTTRDWNTLGSMCWQEQTGKSFKNFLNNKDYISYYLDSETSITESFGNSTTSSQFAGAFNSASEMSRELQFLAGPIAGIRLDAFNPEEFKDSLSELTKIANETLGNDKLFTHLEEGFKTIGKGGKLLFPEIWEDSDFSKSYDISLKLRTPDGDKISWYLNIYVPLMHLLAAATPRELGPNGYKSPYLVRAFYKGLFNVDMGIITSMSVTKAGPFTNDGLPLSVDINISIKDLYGLLMTTGEKYTLAQQPFKFFRNTAIINYLSTTCGINVNSMETDMLVDLYVSFAKNTLSDAYNNIFLKVQNGVTNFVNDVYRNVVYFGNGS